MQVRTVFISDVHLGYRGCRAGALLEFLRTVDARQIFVIGDLIDFWALRRALYWPREHQEVLRALLDIARRGTRVVYLPGHPADLPRDFCGRRLFNVDIRRRVVPRLADGRRMLVIHGDEFDDEVRFSRFRRALGNGIYEVMLGVNHLLDRLRRRFGYGYWSLTAWLKRHVTDARRYIERFEEAAATAAERARCDGVICGHLHPATVRDIDGVLYCNDGDWVESCTALIEDFSGRLSILRWNAQAATAHAATPHPIPAVAVPPVAARSSLSRLLAPMRKRAGVGQSA